MSFQKCNSVLISMTLNITEKGDMSNIANILKEHHFTLSEL